MGVVEAVHAAALQVCERLPVGTHELGVGKALALELGAVGATCVREHLAATLYTASTGETIPIQVGFIDFVITLDGVRLGIELKVAKTVTPAHIRQARGYAAALGIPVVALAIGERAVILEIAGGFPPNEAE